LLWHDVHSFLIVYGKFAQVSIGSWNKNFFAMVALPYLAGRGAGPPNVDGSGVDTGVKFPSRCVLKKFIGGLLWK
jgi:hypothetical protein